MCLKTYKINPNYKTWKTTGEERIIKGSCEPAKQYVVGVIEYIDNDVDEYKIWIRNSVFQKIETGEYLVTLPLLDAKEPTITTFRGDYVHPAIPFVVY